MQPITPHLHNGTDSEKLYAGEALVNAPQPAISPVSGTAGVTYTATEQGMINNTKTALNTLITELQSLGILK